MAKRKRSRTARNLVRNKKRSERRAIKARLLMLRGGVVCANCGYKTKALSVFEFHHLKPHNKEFAIGSMTMCEENWDALVKEAKKCIVLCSNCHREYHWK